MNVPVTMQPWKDAARGQASVSVILGTHHLFRQHLLTAPIHAFHVKLELSNPRPQTKHVNHAQLAVNPCIALKEVRVSINARVLPKQTKFHIFLQGRENADNAGTFKTDI